MNKGAQKCVTQRVKKSAGSSTLRTFMPLGPKKSRVWSSAINSIITPPNKSMESTRGRTPAGECTTSALPPLAIVDSWGVLNQMVMVRLTANANQWIWRSKVDFEMADNGDLHEQILHIEAHLRSLPTL